MEKMANYKNVLVNVNKTIDELYVSLREFIKEHGGFINTSADKYPKYPCNIKSIEYVSGGEVAEWNVLAVKVVGDRIMYCADYDACEEVSDEDLDDYEWFDLCGGGHYYVQTLLNICELIELYV